MKLKDLATKPQLIKLTLDDEQLVAKFGEPLEFYTWDRQPLNIFMKLASATQSDITSIIGVVKTMILDEEGKEILTDENMLPADVLVKVISKIVETLGK